MNDKNRGPWIQTLTGRCWYPFNPSPEDVRFGDLQALARINRYGGHTLCEGYNVADHSVRVALRVEQLGGDRRTCLAALLHDAHEAYPPGDQLGPFLRGCQRGSWHQVPEEFDGLLRVVRYAEIVVRDAFRVSEAFYTDIDGLIKRADLELLATERRDLMAPSKVDWGTLPDPLPGQIVPRSSIAAWRAFGELFDQLGGMGRA